jgi:hypothetical protein
MNGQQEINLTKFNIVLGAHISVINPLIIVFTPAEATLFNKSEICGLLRSMAQSLCKRAAEHLIRNHDRRFL